MITTQAGVDLQSFKYCPGSDTYWTQYDHRAISPSLAVVASLSKVLDVSPTDLGPLHYAVDGDALDELLRIRGSMDGDVSATFTAEDHAITVRNNGSVSITPSRDDENTGRLRK